MVALARSFWLISGLLYACLSHSQDTRAQYPRALSNSFTGVELGYINYRFTAAQLELGFAAEEIRVPHAAVRIFLFGHRFNDNLSAQISYMRPVGWIQYKNINGSGATHEVGMNVAGITINGSIPLTKKWKAGIEAGLGIITRSGFIIGDKVVVKDANYASILLGVGIEYQLNRNWSFTSRVMGSPAHARARQPATVFYSTGVNYTMRPLSKEKVERNTVMYSFPGELVQIGFTTNQLGYGINQLFSKTIPIFWGGQVRVKRGITVQYQRNIFHSRKVFSFDWGATAGWWKTKGGENFFTLSLFPVFRFTALRSKSIDWYVAYSLAGPTFISKPIIDEKQTGKRFTFQDFMGLGIFAGQKKRLNAEIKIAHFSNGNIFPKNEGVMIPLTFGVGYGL
ncbi:MAG: acyloxyacyl hydrolase [Chitinophagaceae bacterium]|nr:acyloxyacyl hydrolase [Chitinophagaceae bacterium]